MAIEIVDLPIKHGDVPWKKYGKSPSSMGKSTISKWAMFNSKLLVITRGYQMRTGATCQELKHAWFDQQCSLSIKLCPAFVYLFLVISVANKKVRTKRERNSRNQVAIGSFNLWDHHPADSDRNEVFQMWKV